MKGKIVSNNNQPMVGASLKIAVAFLVCVALVPAIVFNANGGYGSPLQGNRNIDGYLKLAVLSLHGVLVAMWLYSKFFDAGKPKPVEPLLSPLDFPPPSINDDPEVARPVAPTPRPAGGGARDAYLDNIKSVLTVLVVMHHIACTMQPTPIFFTTHTVLCTRNATAPAPSPGMCIPTSYADNVFNKVFATWFLGINQDWFMTAFFFISAYFTPGSVDRKGARTFLIERAKRLSLPFLVFYFGINAAINAMNSQLDGIPPSSLWQHGGGPTLFFNEGPPWFISWLVLFGLLYVGVHSKRAALKLPAPTLAPLLLFGFLVGLMCTFLSPSGFPPTAFAIPGAPMPGGLYMFVWYIVAWGGGIAAKRGGWLEAWLGTADAEAAIEPGQERFLVTMVALTLVVKFYYEYSKAYFPEFKPAGYPATPFPYETEMSVLMHGIFPVSMFLVTLFGFKRFCNSGTGLWKFASHAAYTVYLIHSLVVVGVMGLYMRIADAVLKSTSGGFVLVNDGGKNDMIPYGEYVVVCSTKGHQELFAWCGFVFVCVVSNGVVWPLAWCVKSLPGCRDVL